MHVSFEHCGHTERFPFSEAAVHHGPLRCARCNAVITAIDVTGAGGWIEAQVARKRQLADVGQLATRKQSSRQSDEEIDRDGLSAELAACVLLCPGSMNKWRKAAEICTGNRGRDLLRSWTGLMKPVEVKHTRYQTENLGVLLVRPPRQTPGRMREEYIDDAYYILMVGQPYEHQLVGWTDREGLIRDGTLNPVPVKPGQRECWGIHWSKLRPLEELIVQVRRGGFVGAIVRKLADQVQK